MNTELNLPPYNVQTRSNGDAVQILDTLRRKFVALTPEEWVRQHFVHYLIDHRGYPAALIANEVSLTLNGMSRRCDTVVYNRADARPLMIVEYKSPDIAITQRVFNQIWRYNTVLQVEWLVVSNGLRHYCCRMRGDTCDFVASLPSYDEITQ